MSSGQLDPASTDAGAMERLLLLETADPSNPHYNRVDSLKAMRWMKQVIDNRLAAPRKSRFGEPADATTETEMIAVGNQFAGFGDYPKLGAGLDAKLNILTSLATATKDSRAAKYAGFVADAITAATEAAPPPDARVANLAAWRTAGSGSPGGDFKLVASLQGNTFYSASPVPALRKAKHHG